MMAKQTKQLPESNSGKKERKQFDPLATFNPALEAKEGLATSLKLVISALTLVSALAWNDAIKAIFTYVRDLFPQSQGQVAEMLVLFLYAIIVTLVTVFAIGRLKNIQKKIDAKEADKE
jgi:hypothetical protein